MNKKIPIKYIDDSPIYQVKPFQPRPPEELPDDLRKLYDKASEMMINEGKAARAPELLKITWLLPSVEKHFAIARTGKLWPGTSAVELEATTEIYMTAFLFDTFTYVPKVNFAMPTMAPLFGKRLIEKDGKIYDRADVTFRAMTSIEAFLAGRGRELRKELPGTLFNPTGRRKTQMAYLYTLQEAARLALAGTK